MNSWLWFFNNGIGKETDAEKGKLKCAFQGCNAPRITNRKGRLLCYCDVHNKQLAARYRAKKLEKAKEIEREKKIHPS